MIKFLLCFQDGIGPLKVVKGGVMLSGKAYFMDTLVASTIKSRTGKPITLVTYRNLSVSVHGSDGQEMSNFLISRCFHIHQSEDMIY